MALEFDPITGDFVETGAPETLAPPAPLSPLGMPDILLDAPPASEDYGLILTDTNVTIQPPKPVPPEFFAGQVVWVGRGVLLREATVIWVQGNGAICVRFLDEVNEGVLVGPEEVFAAKPPVEHVSVMPEFAQKFLDAPTVAAGVPAEVIVPDPPEKMLLFWRRAFEFYVENAYEGRYGAKLTINGWMDIYKSAVKDLSRDRPQVQAEREAFMLYTPNVCWDTDFLIDKADPRGRTFKLMKYTWHEWPNGKPGYQFKIWRAPFVTQSGTQLGLETAMPNEPRPSPGTAVQDSFWKTMQAGLAPAPRPQRR